MEATAIVAAARAIAAGLCMSIGSIAPALGEAREASTALEGMARQPEAAGTLRTNLILSMALTETTGIYSFIIALLLIFVKMS